MNIGIIGTAGRKEDGQKLSKELFLNMICEVGRIIHPYQDEEDDPYLLPNLTLVSGGAAYADHIAVFYFLNQELMRCNLKLFLPASFDMDACQYVQSDNPYDSGVIANNYHRKFSNKIGGNSLLQIKQAIEKNANISIGRDFKSRNTMVANASDIMIALTFGNGPKLKDGGTKDTMKKFINKKENKNSHHIDLNTMIHYSPAEI